MVDTVQHDRPVRGLSRRRLLKTGFGLLGLGTLFTLTNKLGINLSPSTTPPEQSPVPEPTPSVQTQRFIQEGKNLVTEEDKQMFKDTTPGVDLPLRANKRIEKILQIPNIRQRVLQILGFFDVYTNPQYDMEQNGGMYACNTYALAVARALLGDSLIGSRYRRLDGEPWVLGRGDGQIPEQIPEGGWSPENLARFNKEHPFLEGNNLDWWLSVHGDRFGWAGANEVQLQEAMQTGRYIALVVNTESYVAQEQRRAIELEAQRVAAEQAGATPSPSIPPFSGHVAMFVPGGEPGEYGVTQATRNYTYRALDTPRDRLMDPQYHYYLHEIPQESWITPDNPQG